MPSPTHIYIFIYSHNLRLYPIATKMLLSIRLLLSFVSLASSISPASAPDLAAARRNAFRIFNTVHSAMRQFGSSSNHNGLSFFLATVPEGNLFYHGRHSPSRPDSFDWLAFEVEHGYGFAQSRMPMPPPPGRPPRRHQIYGAGTGRI